MWSRGLVRGQRVGLDVGNMEEGEGGMGGLLYTIGAAEEGERVRGVGSGVVGDGWNWDGS